MTMKAVDVPAVASSLNSSHSFFLLEEGNTGYVWAGQFSEKTLRRGALVIAKMLTETRYVTHIRFHLAHTVLRHYYPVLPNFPSCH